MAIPAEEAWEGGDFVICKLVAEDGNIGLGEAFVWLPETGVSPAQIIDSTEHALSRYVLNEDPFRVDRIRDRMDANVARSEVAKGMLDMACYDLMGRVSGHSSAHFMGGRTVDEIPLAALVPLMDPKTMVDLAEDFHAAGVQTLRIKLGNSIEEDKLIMGSLREALGDGVRLRVDYNQAYTPEDAVLAIKAIEPFDVDVAEQPVSATDPLGMAYVQKRVLTPLMAHEGCFSLSDILVLIELDAIRVVGINAERPGGVTHALRAIDYATQRGLASLIHNQSLGVGSAMQIHLAAAKQDALGHDTDLFGHIMMEDDVITDPIDYSAGTAKVPSGPGWGIDLDEGALDRYATGPTVKVEV